MMSRGVPRTLGCSKGQSHDVVMQEGGIRRVPTGHERGIVQLPQDSILIT